MLSVDSQIRLRCPYCGFSLSPREQRTEVCDECGRDFDLAKLLSKQSSVASQEAADKRTMLAERLAGVVGALAILSGIALISFSKVGPAQLLSRWGVGISFATVTLIVRQRIHEEPLYPVLFSFGIVWLVAGLLLWGYL